MSRRMPATDPYSFATIISSLGRLRLRPGRPWLTAFNRAMHPKLAAFKPRDFAVSLLGFALLGYNWPDPNWLFDFLLESRAALQSFRLQDVINTLRGLAILEARAAALEARGERAGLRVPAEWVAALLVRAKACVAAPSGSSSSGVGGGGVAGGSSPGMAIELLVSLAQLKAAPGTALLSATLDRVLCPSSGGQAQGASSSSQVQNAGSSPAQGASGSQGQGASNGQAQSASSSGTATGPQAAGSAQGPPVVATAPVMGLGFAGGLSRPTFTAPAASIDPAATEWLKDRPYQVARLLLALSSFWQAKGDECAWLRRNVRTVDALVDIAGKQLPSMEAGSLVQLLQALAAMRYHPGHAWLDAHEARALQLLPGLKLAALQGLVHGYSQLDRRPPEALLAAAARGAEAAVQEQRAQLQKEMARQKQRELQRLQAQQVQQRVRLSALLWQKDQQRKRQQLRAEGKRKQRQAQQGLEEQH